MSPTDAPSRPAEAQRLIGLTEAEAAARAASGQANLVHEAASRSVGDILKANLLTRFNALLGSMLVVILIVGPLQDAVFGLILVANSLIGIAQELRAKVTLDRLAVLASPRATVVRDHGPRQVRVDEVVLGDLLEGAAGDEVVVDGTLESETPIELNEALLTGESVPIRKSRGQEVLAGSFVSGGHGFYRATRVGEACYARRLTAEARRFQLVRSELLGGINRILRLVTWIVAPTALLLAWSQLRASPSIADALRGSVAAVITLVPEGLVLLTSASLALAVIRLGRRRVLVQQLPAVEMLARTDVVCIDKTGTITEARSSLESVEPLAAGLPWRDALSAIARADLKPNPTMAAIAAAFPRQSGWRVESKVPFSSQRKWSACHFEGRGWWILGAPDVMLATGSVDAARDVLARAAGISASGRRVVLLARGVISAAGDALHAIEPVALVMIVEAVKPEAAETLRRLQAQGVTVKVLSGDHPATVASAAARAGLVTASDPIDAYQLADSPAALVAAAEQGAVFGRVSPDQKRLIIQALRSEGHTVAMIGDGVNDVLALKAADLGIAIGGGSAAARAVAACVLVDGSFAGLPAVLDEGRRVIGNVERLASLFFSKTVYAFLLAISVSFAMLPFPFLPRQLTLISAFTIGIPAIFLTLSASFEPARTAFLQRVLRFAVPAGSVAAAATFSAYALAVSRPGIRMSEERTLATIVMACVGLWILLRLIRPLNPAKLLLLALMLAGLCAALAFAPARQLFELDLPSPVVGVAAVGISSIAVMSLEAIDRGLAQMKGRGANGTRNASTLALAGGEEPAKTGIDKEE